MLLRSYKQSFGRHKSSSRRSLSEAALRFGNICVYKPSSLRRKPSNPWKKPSNLQCSCAAYTRLEKCSKCRHHFLLDTYCTVKGSLEMHLCYLWGVLKTKVSTHLFVILSSGKVYSTHMKESYPNVRQTCDNVVYIILYGCPIIVDDGGMVQ